MRPLYFRDPINLDIYIHIFLCMCVCGGGGDLLSFENTEKQRKTAHKAADEHAQ